VVRCSRCRHVFLPDGFLPEGGTRGEGDNTHFEEAEYLAWREESESLLRRVARRRARLVLSKVERKSGVVLELGCSTGEMLDAMAREGWEAYGVDLSERAVAAARRKYPDIHVSVGTEAALLEDSSTRRFDIIMAFHVLEHIRDVGQVLRNCERLIAPGGYLVLFVPNWESWSRFVFRDSWPDFMPEHIHLFSRASMTTLLERHSFKIVYAGTAGNSWAWLGGALRLLRGARALSSRGAAGRGRRMPGAFKMRVLKVGDALLSPWFLFEKLLGGGNELQVIAQTGN
jgi:2-polyprenyl-3-methyl-5-hydroxy-6-metoxy-1,4-benzoquinol methylase